MPYTENQQIYQSSAKLHQTHFVKVCIIEIRQKSTDV